MFTSQQISHALQFSCSFRDSGVLTDIRDVAVSVNERLKKLITPEDDEDFLTDQTASTTADTLHTPSQRRGGVPPPTTTITPSPNSQQSQVTSGQAGSTAPLTTSIPAPLSSSPSHTSQTTAPETPDTSKQTESPKLGRPIGKQGGQSPSMSRKSDTDQEGVVGREKAGEGNGEEGGGGPQLPEPRLHLLAVLGVLIPHMKFTLPETRMETLRWLMWLHQQLPKRVG